MGPWTLVWCLLGTTFALPLYPPQSGTHGMASMSFESMRRYGNTNGMSTGGINMRPQYGFGDRFPSWWMPGQTSTYPWMPRRAREHESQQYEYALPVHPPPLPAQQIPLQPPQPGLQAPSLPQQPPAVIPAPQDPLQPGQQQETLPSLQQGEQTLVQQQVAPPEGQPQQFQVWEYTDQQGRSLFPILSKWLQYESVQPVQPQLEQGTQQPIQPQLHQGPIQPQVYHGPIQPQLHQGPSQPIQPQLNQGLFPQVHPHLEQGSFAPLPPHLHQGAIQPIHPQLHQGPMQPVHPFRHQGPIQHVQPQLHLGPVYPLHPQMHQGAIPHAYPGLYYVQYATDPAGSPARLGIVSSEEMQGGTGGGTHAYNAMYPGFAGTGPANGGGRTALNSVFQGDFTTEDDAPAARGTPTGQGGVVLVQNGNTPGAGSNVPVDGAAPPVAVVPLPGNTILIPEGIPVGQGSVPPQPNSNYPNLAPDPAGQSKLPIGQTPTQVSLTTQAISDSEIAVGTGDTTPIGVQKEAPPSAADTTVPTGAQSTTAGKDKAQPKSNWYFQEP